MGDQKSVGSIVIYRPSETDEEQDWLTFILPAWKGQVQLTVHIRSCHIDGALQGLTDEDDVAAFLETHRPWLHCSYSIW